ncbi:MAG TPA: hypothetical protein VHX42_01795 [Candidatus Babeliales bacterium]|jgi:WD40 repeat protein|nr:hypothetical protein [Candidatus Babeliales bacterium]
MNIKIISFFAIVFWNNLLIGIESQNSNYTHNNQQTWSLYKTIKNDENDCFISAICFDPSEKLLAIADCHKHVCIRDVISNKKLMSKNFDDEINSICFDQAGDQFAVLLYTPETHIFKIHYDERKKTIRYNPYYSLNHTGNISSIFFDNNNNICGIKLKMSQKMIQCIDLATNTKYISFEYDQWIKVIAVSPSKKYFVMGSDINHARLFDTEHSEEVIMLQLQSSVSACAFDSSEKFLAIASNDNIVHIFDLNTFTEISSFSHNRYISTICFGSSGKTLAIGSFNGKIHIFKQN